jgi:hypothetical protein
VILLLGFLQTEWGQNWLARQVTGRLSKELQTRISIDNVRIGFFNKMDLKGVLVEDQKKDTLLYAGTLQVRITDWFFFKDQADLKYIGLQNAQVNFNRTDSIWNYTFLEKYFASTDTTKKREAGISFNLKQLDFENVSFEKKDAWLGNDLKVSFKSMDMDADDISITRQIVRVKSLDLVDPYFYTYNYKGNKTTPKNASVASGTAPVWDVVVSDLNLTNGRFRTGNERSQNVDGVFNSLNMDFSAINGTMENVGWAGDTLRGRVDISTKERSGLIVRSLKANTTIQPHAMIFEDLFLQTNRSTLTNYFSMRYEDTMDDFETNVTMEANFANATLSSDDIAFFAPDAKAWNRVIRINGLVKGTVDALNAQGLEIWAGNKTYINGNLSLVGLPNIQETLINLEARELRTTYADAISFIPALRKITTPNLRKLSYVRFKGNFTGLINDFVTFGTVQTGLGTLTTDLNMKFPSKAEPVYSGTVSTSNFELGQFLNEPRLGAVAFNGRMKGRSFDWNKLDLDFNGTVQRVHYGDYTYRNITANGTIGKKRFNGNFEIKDPNADLSLTGLIDMSGRLPVFNMNADVRTANLRELQLTQDNIQLSGLFDLNIEGNSLSTLMGTARISNAGLMLDGNRMAFDSLYVFSGYLDDTKTLIARSNEFDARITGYFDIAALPESFSFFLSRYYPSYIKTPATVMPQEFTFDITTGVVEDYLRLVDPRLTGFNNSKLTGSLNTTANTMTIDADVPYFTFQQYEFSDVQIRGSGDLNKLVLTGQVNNAMVNEDLFFPETSFSIEAKDDISNITVTTTANQTINQANLSAQIRTFSDGATINFNTSSFTLNGKNWNIDQGGELNFRQNTIVQGQLLLRESNQRIQIETRPSAIGNWNDLHISLQNLNLGDLSPFLMPDNRLEGLVNGNIVVEDPQNKLNILADLRTEELRLDNDSLGQVIASMAYNNRTGMLTGRGGNVDPVHKIDFDLALDLKDTANTHRDRISLRPENFQLSYLERFIGDIFSDIEGFISGNVDIIGEGRDREFLAGVRLKDASFLVNFTQVRYKVEDRFFEMKKDRIDLDGFRLRDTAGNRAILRGSIRHRAFENMFYDLLVQTESPQMLLINTTYNDNQDFYGKAWGSGTFVLVGPQSDMLMSIDVKASQTDSSYITLPPSTTRQSGQASFMVEKKYGTEMNPGALRGSATNLKFNITLAANPMVNMEVILDDLTGDVIKGRGSGILTITSGTTTPLAINGRFDIYEGNYQFTFQSFFKKPFVLKPQANNYIEWTGDPYKAQIKLDAVYTAENVSFAPLANTLLAASSTTGLARFRDDVNVVASLTGELFQPDFKFKLEFPSNNVLYRDPSVAFGIQQIERNPNELNKQVTYLIVFNSFAPYENVQSNAVNPFGEAISSTISGLLFGEVNRRVNELLGSVLQRNNVTLNFTGSLYNRNLIDQNQRGLLRINQGDVNVSLGKSLFEGRLNFSVGGTFDVPIQNDFQQSVRLFPDVTIELLLNKTGSVRANFFYRENVDFLTAATSGTGNNPQTRRYGTSLSYGKEFNSFGELFFGKIKASRGNLKPVDSIPPALRDSL